MISGSPLQAGGKDRKGRQRTGALSIIGGMFGLERDLKAHASGLPILKGHQLLLANARSGIAILYDQLRPRQVWVPSYLCSTMLQGIIDRTCLRFYPVDGQMEVSRAWFTEVSRNDLVVFIDYFGILCNRSLLQEVSARGAWVLEDASQALLTCGAGEFADFVLFSPRKFLGVPDGGILVSRHGVLGQLRLDPTPANWSMKAIAAVVLRREFDLYGGERPWYTLFHEIEQESPIGYYAMTGLSWELLQHGFDYDQIARRRLSNYGMLLDHLRQFALFPHLPAGCVPLGFPVRMKNRDHVRRHFFEHGVYPPIHWPIRDVVPREFSESHQLNAEIMTLPCDQRYEPATMEWMAGLAVEEAQPC